MKRRHLIVFFWLALATSSFAADTAKPHSVTPKEGLVPREETAVAIAVAVWTPIYGKEAIERQKPYHAKLKDGVWHVTGSLPARWRGGVALAEIQKADGKILRVSHGK